ncbi:MAG: DUF3556 domain-containing protein [Deltaproteobacteria bacterium]|nr:DUF3556 domain-containing protein [Deltaproteobacteria bacterium]
MRGEDERARSGYPAELRCIFVESQPMGRPTHAWTIADAATGVRETGQIAVKDLLDLQPWPPMPEG